METFAAVVVAVIVLVFLAGGVLAFKVRAGGDQTVAGTSPEGQDAPRDVTQIGLGGSIIEAQVIEQRLRAQGYTVSLLKHEHPETGSFTALGNTALLVLRDEEQAIREELGTLGY